MGYYKEQYVSPKNFKTQIQPIATAIIPLQQKYKAMEEQFKKTPKVVTHNPNAKPVYRHEKLNSLLDADKYLIYVVGDSYVIRAKDESNSLELTFAVYRNFLMSEFVQVSSELVELITNYFSYECDESHPKQQQTLNELLEKQKALKNMIAQLKNYVQKELF
ncbi:hypothetical protein V9L05_19870 [Bernardetia sp. Wsw4-3y2]|uniref:hypothetical protein n=1 Tax=Bernardetia sp. Wsw4-3y2 TaxID=3127471 RepID=UPI0030D56949